MEQRKILTLLFAGKMAIGFETESRAQTKALQMVRAVAKGFTHIQPDRNDGHTIWFDVWRGDITEEEHYSIGVSVDHFDANRIYLSE